ncbi:MAG: Spy/CpxP family protein refolding chaperone [Cyanobacteria bacterium J06638_20]
MRGLTAQEVDDLLQGRGAGFARMAELNRYPGPRHVLDLKDELALSPDQAQVIQVVFDDMQTQAQTLGKAIVEQEQAVSQAFATAAITPERLHQQTQELANLYGDLRATHLQAHLEITPLLSAEQIERYDQLRGYTDTSSTVPHQHH